MVCLSSASPSAEQLLRKAARLADRLSAPWYAVYIQTPQEELHRIDAATQRRITNSLTLTQQMGGTPMTFKGSDVVSTVAAFAAEYGITHIVMGRSKRPWYRRWAGQSVLEGLLQAIPGADVIVVGRNRCPGKIIPLFFRILAIWISPKCVQLHFCDAQFYRMVAKRPPITQETALFLLLHFLHSATQIAGLPVTPIVVGQR